MQSDLALLKKYFPDLNEKQQQQFAALKNLYSDWNAKINVISRKDIDSLYEKHVLHSLGIAKVIHFKANTKILDVGTGGGFPGIPLAILFPECEFLLVDSIGKKIKVVEAVIQALDLKNVRSMHTRVEQINEKFDFIVSRAVTELIEFYSWVKTKFNSQSNNDIKNGILYLKGGDLSQEVGSFKPRVKLFPLSDFFTEEFYDTKVLVYLPV